MSRQPDISKYGGSGRVLSIGPHPYTSEAHRLCRLMRKSTDKGVGATSDIPDAPRPGRDLEGLGLDVRAASVSASADGVLVLDSDGRVMYASPAYCRLFGL